MVVKRGKPGERAKNETRIYVNGYVVARGAIGPAQPGQSGTGSHVRARSARPSHSQGDLDEVRIYRRALGEAEIQGLVQPGKQFVQPPATGAFGEDSRMS